MNVRRQVNCKQATLHNPAALGAGASEVDKTRFLSTCRGWKWKWKWSRLSDWTELIECLLNARFCYGNLCCNMTFNPYNNRYRPRNQDLVKGKASCPRSVGIELEPLPPIVVQLLSLVRLFASLWTAACQPSLSFTISWSLLKFLCIELVMPSNHIILCHPLLLLPSIFPSIRVFSNESALCIR